MGKVQWFRDRLRNFASQLKHGPCAARILRHAAGNELGIWICLLLIQGLLPAGVVILSKDFVDEFVRLTQSGTASARDYGSILRVGGFIIGLLVMMEVFRAVASWLRVRITSRLQDHVNDLIHGQSVDIDVAFYDLPDYHDRLHRDRDEASYRPAALLDNAGSLLQSLTTLLAMAAVLLPYGYGMAIALIVSTLPALWVVSRQAAREHGWRRQSSAEDRRSHYLSWMMVGAHAAGEMRLYGLGQQFRRTYNGIRDKLRFERDALAAKQGIADATSGSISGQR